MNSGWDLLRRLVPYVRRQWPYYAVALSVAPLSAALMVVQPWLLKRAIDEAILPGDLNALQALAGWYLVAVIAGFFVEASYTLSISYGAMRTIASIRDDVFSHTLSRALSFYDKEPTGKLLTRATSDIEALGETLTAGAVTIVLDALLVVAILIAMFALDAKLTLVMLVLAPVLAFVVNYIRRILRTLYQRVRTTLAELNAFTAERLSGVQVIQLYQDEERALEQFRERLLRYRDATIRTNIWDATLYAMVDGLGSITMALMLWYGAGGILDGAVTAGLVAAFIDYVAKLFRPIQEFSAKVAIIQRAIAALEKIFGLLDVDEAISAGKPLPAKGTGHVVLRDVRFAYGDGGDVLQGLDLEVRPGEAVALVGRTGSGKTTVSKLLTRAYEGYRGTLTLDGHELSTLDPADVRRTVGMVRQDVQLFPGDVRFNLTLGADIDDAALMDAVKLVQADGVVERLGGLDGRISHDGANLSVGEAQLISFARTMAHDPPVVILDEATASVDSLTEARIQTAIANILARKTTVVIAHRLSTITGADRIALLDRGKVVEVGPHDALMAQGGRYARLFDQQFAS